MGKGGEGDSCVSAVRAQDAARGRQRGNASGGGGGELSVKSSEKENFTEEMGHILKNKSLFIHSLYTPAYANIHTHTHTPGLPPSHQIQDISGGKGLSPECKFTDSSVHIPN